MQEYIDNLVNMQYDILTYLFSTEQDEIDEALSNLKKIINNSECNDLIDKKDHIIVRFLMLLSYISKNRFESIPRICSLIDEFKTLINEYFVNNESDSILDKIEDMYRDMHNCYNKATNVLQKTTISIKAYRNKGHKSGRVYLSDLRTPEDFDDKSIAIISVRFTPPITRKGTRLERSCIETSRINKIRGSERGGMESFHKAAMDYLSTIDFGKYELEMITLVQHIKQQRDFDIKRSLLKKYWLLHKEMREIYENICALTYRIDENLLISLVNVFSRVRLFKLFSDSPHILHHLITNGYLPHRHILYYNNINLALLYPEFKDICDIGIDKIEFTDDLYEIITKHYDYYLENRLTYTFENPLLNIIQKDDVEEFITYITIHNIKPDTWLSLSPLDSPKFNYLSGRSLELICHACRAGAMSIVKYLHQTKKQPISEETLNLAIHSCNPELIHYHEDAHINMVQRSLIPHVITCFDIDVARYFFENYITLPKGNFSLSLQKCNYICAFEFCFQPRVLKHVAESVEYYKLASLV